MASGRVVPVGEPFPDRRPPPLDDLRQVAERVRGLVDLGRGHEALAAE
jgi:hypothetical protein